jgi:hypothetical protein
MSGSDSVETASKPLPQACRLGWIGSAGQLLCKQTQFLRTEALALGFERRQFGCFEGNFLTGRSLSYNASPQQGVADEPMVDCERTLNHIRAFYLCKFCDFLYQLRFGFRKNRSDPPFSHSHRLGDTIIVAQRGQQLAGSPEPNYSKRLPAPRESAAKGALLSKVFNQHGVARLGAARKRQIALRRPGEIVDHVRSELGHLPRRSAGDWLCPDVGNTFPGIYVVD